MGIENYIFCNILKKIKAIHILVNQQNNYLIDKSIILCSTRKELPAVVVKCKLHILLVIMFSIIELKLPSVTYPFERLIITVPRLLVRFLKSRLQLRFLT